MTTANFENLYRSAISDLNNADAVIGRLCNRIQELQQKVDNKKILCESCEYHITGGIYCSLCNSTYEEEKKVAAKEANGFTLYDTPFSLDKKLPRNIQRMTCADTIPYMLKLQEEQQLLQKQENIDEDDAVPANDFEDRTGDTVLNDEEIPEWLNDTSSLWKWSNIPADEEKNDTEDIALAPYASEIEAEEISTLINHLEYDSNDQDESSMEEDIDMRNVTVRNPHTKSATIHPESCICYQCRFIDRLIVMRPDLF